MSKNLVSFSLLGCGRMGSKYLSMFSSGLIHNAKITAACDKKGELLTNVNCDFLTTNFGDLCKRDMPKNIIIATDSELHFEHAKKAIEAQKNVIIEKPITMRSSDALVLDKLATKHNVSIFPVLQHRCNPIVQSLKKIVETKKIGKTILVTGNLFWCRNQSYFDQAEWRGKLKTDGGVIFNQGIHLIDLVEWVFGPLQLINATEGRKLCDIEAPETVICNFKNEDGVIVNLNLSLASRPKDQKTSLTILSETGYLEIDGKSLNKIVVKHPLLDHLVSPVPSSHSIVKTLKEIGLPDVYGEYHVHFLNKVVDALNRVSLAQIDVKSASRTLVLIENIFERLAFEKRD